MDELEQRLAMGQQNPSSGPSGQIVQAPNLSMVPVNEGQSKSGGEEMAVDQGNKDPASNDNAQVQNSASAPTGTPVARPKNSPSKADKGNGNGNANVTWRQDESMEDCSEEEIAIPMEDDENSDSDDEREESDDEAPVSGDFILSKIEEIYKSPGHASCQPQIGP